MSKFDLRRYAHELNDASRSHPIGSLQEIRAKLHDKRKAGQNIFSNQTIFKEWAFHHGGRSELQFNIGFDGTKGKELRSGIAFSFETSRSFPDIEPLIDKARLFNEFLRMNPNLYRDMRMWSWSHGERVEFPVGPISPELAAKGVFVFLGNLRPVNELAHNTVLNDMDRLVPLYEYVESEGRTDPFAIKGENGFVFRSGKKSDMLKTKASYAQQELDIELRHNFLQDLLERQLKRQYGSDKVCHEVSSGLGNNRIDLAVRSPQGYWFYDIKTFASPRACIREAIGQLLEYAFWPGCQEACRLIVVGEPAPDDDVLEYCHRLKDRFSLPIEYQQIVLKDS
jgi:hypothetical protein